MGIASADKHKSRAAAMEVVQSSRKPGYGFVGVEQPGPRFFLYCTKAVETREDAHDFGRCSKYSVSNFFM